MPKYGTINPAPFLGSGYPLNQYNVFNAEAITLNEFSERVGVPLGPNIGSRGIRVEVDFSANPGNVEIDILEGDTDNGGTSYGQVPISGSMTQANLTSGPNGASTRLASDQIPIGGQFSCLFVKVAPSNAGITCTARITRAA